MTISLLLELQITYIITWNTDTIKQFEWLDEASVNLIKRKLNMTSEINQC